MTTAADDCAQASQGFLAQDLAGTASQSELAMASAAHMRVVRFPRDYVFTDYTDLQSAWMNHVSGSVYPSAAVFVGDQLVLRTNSLGCKGPELEPGRPVIGFWCMEDRAAASLTMSASATPRP